MPGGDRTGPLGMGPRTGRGAGSCAGYQTPGYMSSVGGRGFWGRGRGGGRGWCHWLYATGLPFWARFREYALPGQQPSNRELERQALKGRADALQSELDSLKKRISEMATTREVKQDESMDHSPRRV
jgi:hypothetical protein